MFGFIKNWWCNWKKEREEAKLRKAIMGYSSKLYRVKPSGNIELDVQASPCFDGDITNQTALGQHNKIVETEQFNEFDPMAELRNELIKSALQGSIPMIPEDKKVQ